MRTVRLRASLLTIDIVARACAEVESARGRVPTGEPRVLVLVNDETMGVVAEEVWATVSARLSSLLGSMLDSETSEPEPVFESGSRARRTSVLVVQPATDPRARLLAAFAGAGFDAVGLADGQRALSQLALRPVQVLVVEFELPRIAGDELIARARASASPPALTVLLGNALPEVLVPKGADLVIGQPFEATDVVSAVERALRTARASRA